MAAHNFETALEHIFAVEGGYVDHPKDPGGATNRGITRATLAAWRKKTVSKQNVKNLTRHEAAQIYRANYWDKVCGDDLPSGVDIAVFDHAVHSGPARAIRNLQGAINVPMDGIYGTVTASAVQRFSAENLITTLCERRMMMLKRLPTWNTFGKGWTRRLDDVRNSALKRVVAQKEIAANSVPQDPPRKSLLASRTVWGALIAIVAQILLMAGFPLSADTQAALVEMITQIVGLGGAAFAIWGRMVANTPLIK